MMYSIVGQYYREREGTPARAIFAVLPTGAELILLPEPTNEHDPNAIMVILESTQIPDNQHQKLDELAMGFGHSSSTILAQEFWHLGYIKATDAKVLKLQEQKTAKLCFGNNGGCYAEL